jgi:SAM-dependent methyltransferase
MDDMNTEYSTPSIYESEYGGDTSDFDIFCPTVSRGEALDMACGTGRITTKLAEVGLRCTGIDTSNAMLEYAKQKAKNRGLRITYLHRDMRAFSLRKKFDLITMAGNSFQALLRKKDQIHCLSSIVRHMHRESLWIMSTRNMTKGEMRTTAQFEHWHDFTDDQNQQVQVYGMQRFDPNTNIVTYITKRSWQKAETITHIDLKFTSYRDLLEMLRGCGLDVVEVYGNFMKEPFDPLMSKEMIFLCKAISPPPS